MKTDRLVVPGVGVVYQLRCMWQEGIIFRAATLIINRLDASDPADALLMRTLAWWVRQRAGKIEKERKT